MEGINNYIQNKLIEYKNSRNGSNISSADEIKKFKDLLDTGIINKDEFEAKKKQLLKI